MNLTRNPQRIRGKTHLGTVVPVSPVYRAVPQQVDSPRPKTEVDKDYADFVVKIYEKLFLNTESRLTSSSEFVILSLADPTEEGFSDREKRKRTDPS